MITNVLVFLYLGGFLRAWCALHRSLYLSARILLSIFWFLWIWRDDV